MAKKKRRKGLARAPRPKRGEAKRAEQLLIDALPASGEGTALCSSLGRGQLARALVDRGWSPVRCWFLDLAQLENARGAREMSELPPGLELTCTPDMPTEKATCVALPLNYQGDGELTRDLIQQALLALDEGGTLWLATDNPKDRWLRDLLKKLPLKVRPTLCPEGVVYQVTPEAPLKRVRNYDAEFAYRFGERLFEVSSRPGVFAHRRIDPGARALLETLPETPGARVLEVGCGLGAVALGVASLDPAREVVAIDSNARAVACTQANAERNGVENLRAVHTPAEAFEPVAPFDLVLANPPYYSKGKIATAFVDVAARSLRPGGLLHLVTKRPRDYNDIYERGFADVEVEEVRGYQVLFAIRGDGPARTPGDDVVAEQDPEAASETGPEAAPENSWE